MRDDRYDKVTYHGHLMDKFTQAAVEKCEKRLGYELTVLQGSYNAGGVSASAGTHDGGGVLDFAPWDWENKVRVMREVGFAAWHRPAIPGLWGEHIHAVLIGNKRMSPAAARQVVAFKDRRDGLADNGPDTGPWVGVHHFRYRKWIARRVS